MFAGHVGAGLAIARAERRINLGIFIFAAVFLDVLLWLLVLLGWEAVIIPADFARTHQPQFVFPWSHGLFASLAWSAAAGVTTFFCYPALRQARARAAALVAAAVFSHWLLDALVHVPELPLAGARSIKLGLGLWQTMPLALIIEAGLALAGLYLFVSGSALGPARKVWLSVLSVVILGLTVAGMTVAPAPPSATAMASTSLVSIVLVCALAAWLGRASDPAGR